jgi:hypothetical protein
MAKLFLIRRNMETFTGPLTLAEMKDAHKRMQFGLSDEVSGHCGPWVQFDKINEIKRHYPEIARVVHEEMLAGWGVSDHTGARLVGGGGDGDTKRLAVKPQRGVGLALTFLVIALVAFAAAVYMASGGGRFSGKAGTPSKEVSPKDAQGFLDRSEFAQFDEYMGGNVDGIVQSINLDKKLETAWLPYLRLYAFNHEGAIPGFPVKTLRGQAAASAPSDCSLKQWRKRWRSSYKQWIQLIGERKLVRSHWARMLAWDPHWIRRRDNKGWIGNQNYYTACLTMADRALDELSSDTSLVQNAGDWARMGYPQVKRRLIWILEIARDGHSVAGAPGDAANALSVWTCMEQARDLKSLSKCKEGLIGGTAEQDAFLSYTDERYAWNALRIAATTPGAIAAETVSQLDKLAAKAGKGDFYTRFDYRAEQKLLKTLSKATPGEKGVDKIVEKVSAEFPDVNLAH